MNYSFVTESIVLAAWSITPWYLFYIFKSAGHSDKKVWSFTLFGLLWAIFGFNAGRYGFDALPGPLSEVRPLVYLIITLTLTFLFRWQNSRKRTFPKSVGWGDLLVGVLALYATVKYYNKAMPDKWVKIVAIVGGLDFCICLFLRLHFLKHSISTFLP